MTDEILLESRRDLRERAFQALMALEYDGDIVEACRFAYLHDKDLAEDKEVDLPAFLMNLVTGGLPIQRSTGPANRSTFENRLDC